MGPGVPFGIILCDRSNITPLAGAVVAIVGAALVTVAGGHVLVEHRDPIAVLLGGLVPALLATGVVAAGVHLARSGKPPRQSVRILGWWLFGITVTATMGLAAVAYSYSHGIVVADQPFVLTNNVTARAAGGLVVGFYETRSRRRAEALETEREKLELLTRVLRHDIRNDLNVVLPTAGLIEKHGDEETLEYVRKLKRAANEAVELTDTTGTFLETLEADADRGFGPVDFQAVVDEQVERTREKYPNAVVEREPVPAVRVLADDLFDAVVRNLLTNAIQHNDSETPHVAVRADVEDDSVVLRVADDGPGIPDDRKDEVFGRGERGLESGGSGIGLYLVDSLVADYGGEVWIGDRDPRGAVFAVRLRLADEASAVEPADVVSPSTDERRARTR